MSRAAMAVGAGGVYILPPPRQPSSKPKRSSREEDVDEEGCSMKGFISFFEERRKEFSEIWRSGTCMCQRALLNLWIVVDGVLGRKRRHT